MEDRESVPYVVLSGPKPGWSESVMVALRSFSSLMRCTPPQSALRRIVLLVCLPLVGDQTFLV